MKDKILVGIAGPSGSGKTTIANMISTLIGKSKVVVISMDRYYKDLSYLPKDERDNQNFDTPEIFDWEKLIKDLRDLKNGKPIECPIYSFTESIWKGFEKIEPKEVIIVEGIFALYNEELTRLMDLRIYVDTPLDICLIRRIKRDMAERFKERSLDKAIEEWVNFVRPGYEKYIAPSAKNAHLIIPEDPDGEMRKIAIEAMKDMVLGRLCS